METIMSNNSYFRSSGYLQDNKILTESGETLDLTQLPPFLRTLLVADGTVTKSLEAWFWEKVKIEPINNQLETLEEEVLGIEVEQGDRVLQREVILIREKGVETYRDIFSINYHSVSPVNDHLLSGIQSEILSRSYRIRVNGHPAIIVTEFFPIDIYK